MKNAIISVTFLSLFILISTNLSAQIYITLHHDQPPALEVLILEDLIFSGEPVQLGIEEMISGGSGEYFYHWDPEQGLDDPNVAMPMASPEEDVEYVLTVTDKNGCTESTSQIVMVDKTGFLRHSTQPDINVYPIPAKNIVNFNIRSNLILNELSVLIYDIAGHGVKAQQFHSKNYEFKYSIDLSDFQPGSYLMVISSPNFISNHNIILF